MISQEQNVELGLELEETFEIDFTVGEQYSQNL